MRFKYITLLHLASFLKAWGWSKKLKKVERYVSREPVMNIKETISKYSGEVIYTLIGLGLYLLGLPYFFRVIP